VSPTTAPSALEVTNRRDHYLYYNGHGDLAAEADASGSRTALHTYDPFGAPTDAPPANSTSHRFTGAWDKQYDSTSSLVLMGARPYDPNLGRFLAVDPIDGGSLNNYDYAGQDPINGYDLSGTMLEDASTGGVEGTIDLGNGAQITIVPVVALDGTVPVDVGFRVTMTVVTGRSYSVQTNITVVGDPVVGAQVEQGCDSCGPAGTTTSLMVAGPLSSVNSITVGVILPGITTGSIDVSYSLTVVGGSASAHNTADIAGDNVEELDFECGYISSCRLSG
jgi:RHS repeat-associated protein